MTKKEEKLNPEIERVNVDVNTEELKVLAQEMQSTIVSSKNDNDSDTYFRNIVNSLDDRKKISTNTEYLSVQENFTGTKLEFLSQFAYMPFLKNFVEIFETKRVSLERKGRIEKIKALQERQQELKTERLQNLANVFGVQ